MVILQKLLRLMHIRSIDSSEVSVIQHLAHRIWPDTFGDILSKEQIAYMLNWMYSLETLSKQLSEGHRFFIYEEHGVPLGFMGIELFDDHSVKIHKLYVSPDMQGTGIGKKFIDFVKTWAKDHRADAVFLNVNRFNNAVDFYKHIGMAIIKTEDIEIGNGFLMEDYVMELKLS
jgi:GNAT superfamily N-acetyltransferase